MWLLALLIGCTPPGGEYFGLSRANQPADALFFNNATEPEYIDPGLATGMPDGRIISELFDGLTEYHPEDLTPQPSHAASWEAHPDGQGFTFHLRPEAMWSDGTPITAEDYLWSWERVLNPIFLSRYAQQLYAVQNAERYNHGRVGVLAVAHEGAPAGTVVHLEDSNALRLVAPAAVHEAPEGPVVTQLPEGLVLLREGAEGDWVEVAWRPACPDLTNLPALQRCTGPTHTGWVQGEVADTAWPSLQERVVVEAHPLLDDAGARVGSVRPGQAVAVVEREADRRRVYDGSQQRFGWLPATALANPRADLVRYEARVEEVEAPAFEVAAGAVHASREVLGARATGPHTLEVRLEGVAPYFLQQTSHMTLRAAPRHAIERWGARWTRPEHIVTSGPFLLDEHVVRDKFVLKKNPRWWGVDLPEFGRMVDTVHAYSTDSQHVSANLYRAGYTDLVVGNDIPPEFIPILEDRRDYSVSPAWGTYYFRLNTTRPPLDDPKVRRALAMAVDRGDIVEVLKAGEIPAHHVVPPGIEGYEPAVGPGFDPEEARRLLAEAGYPGGEGFPTMRVLYNTLESHRLVAAVLQDQWRRHLGVEIRLENREWMTYLKTVDDMDYDIARAGWIGDYLDPNTFLDLWVTDGGNNNTGWSSARFDALITEAGQEPDPELRMALLAEAEAILNEEMPFIPIYWYVWASLKQPDVRGYHPNVQDQHPLRYVWLDR